MYKMAFVDEGDSSVADYMLGCVSLQISSQVQKQTNAKTFMPDGFFVLNSTGLMSTL